VEFPLSRMRRKICSMKTPISVLRCSLKLVMRHRKIWSERPNILGTGDTLFFTKETQRDCFSTLTQGTLDLKTGPQFCNMANTNSNAMRLLRTSLESGCPGGRSVMLCLQKYEKARRASRWQGFKPCS